MISVKKKIIKAINVGKFRISSHRQTAIKAVTTACLLAGLAIGGTNLIVNNAHATTYTVTNTALTSIACTDLPAGTDVVIFPTSMPILTNINLSNCSPKLTSITLPTSMPALQNLDLNSNQLSTLNIPFSLAPLSYSDVGAQKIFSSAFYFDSTLSKWALDMNDIVGSANLSLVTVPAQNGVSYYSGTGIVMFDSLPTSGPAFTYNYAVGTPLSHQMDVAVSQTASVLTLPQSYTYLLPPPTIIDIDPKFGPVDGGTSVEITGTNFGFTPLFKQVSAGSWHTCGLTYDNQAYCWGWNDSGQIGDGTSGTNRLVPTAVDTGPTSGLYGKTVLAISAGEGHTCAIASDNQAYCWGENYNGQIGDGTTDTNRLIPTAVDTGSTSGLNGKTVLSISAGAYHTCALADDNQVYCWGWNDFGQVGDGTSGTDRIVPTTVNTSSYSGLNGKTVLAISAGGYHNCAIADNNQVYCWGSNFSGQIGDGTSYFNRLVPTAVDTGSTSGLNGKTVLVVSAGSNHTCAIASNNQAYCWGYNGRGQIGDSTLGTDRLVPTAVNTGLPSGLNGKTVLAISAGGYHTCAIANDNQAYCWGQNNYGQIGDNTSGTDYLIPTAVNTGPTSGLNGKTALSISAGGYRTCVIASDKQTYCWGQNNSGQIGDDTSGNDRLVPTAISTLPIVSSISSVAFDDIAASSFTVNSDTSITAITPPHAAGAVDVVITTIDGQTFNYSVVSYGGFTFVAPDYINMTVDTDMVEIGITPTPIGAFGYGSNVATVKTNMAGYDLFVSTTVDNNDLHHLSLPASIISTHGTWSSQVALGNNTWGFTLTSNPTDSASIWSAVPDKNDAVNIKSTNTPNELGDETTLHYGVKVNTNQLGGFYQTTIIYTAIGKI